MIFCTENLIAYFTKIFDFIIIYRNKDNTIIRKQVSCNFETRIYHI